MNFLLELGLKSVLLIGVAGLATLFLRKSSATIRHRVLALGFLALAILPLLSLRMPEIQVERPGMPFRSTPIRMTPPKQVQAIHLSAPAPAVQPLPAQSSSVSWQQIFVAIWVLGTLVFLTRTAYRLGLLSRLGRSGEDLAGEILTGLPPHTRVLATSAVKVPVTFGFLRPTVLVPQEWRDWPEGRLRAVLLHEWAHIHRGDWAWFIFASIVRDLYWPNPFTHWTVAKLRVESEFAADEEVLAAGIPGPAYAETLVDLAESLRGRSVAAGIPFVELNSLKTRVAAILSNSAKRKPLHRGTATALFFLVAAVMIPYAAVKMVSSPTQVRDGDAQLVDGSHVQIIAITQMQGNSATSWDMHGAFLKHSFPIDDNVVRMLNAGLPDARKKSKTAPQVRYVVFRLDRDDSPFLALQPWNELNEGDQLWDGPVSANFTDAIGGHYAVFRVSYSGHPSSANLRIKVPSAAWTLYAYQSYKNGKATEMLNAEAGINISPTMPNLGHGTQATFVLPPNAVNQEATARFWPLQHGGTDFIEVAGPRSATADLAPEAVQRVELLTRPLQTVEFTGIPLLPDPKAAYTPRHFLPDALIDAEHGQVKLSDGTTIAIANLENSGVRTGDADNDGNPIIGTPEPGNGNILEKRRIRVWAKESLNGADMAQTLYDGEGWALGEGTISRYEADKKLIGFSWFDTLRGQSTDIVSQVAVGSFHDAQRFSRTDKQSATWSYQPNGTLRLEYPKETSDKWANMDAEFRPMDAKGNVVRRADQGDMTQMASTWIEFYLTPQEAKRVVTVEVRARPYVWVRFKDVSEEPSTVSKAGSSSTTHQD